MRPLLVPLALGATLLALALAVRSGWFARSRPGEPINAAARAASAAPELSSGDARLIAERYGTARLLPSGLRYIITAPGRGATVRAGDTVAVHFDGWLLSGGKFDSSRDRGQPLLVRAGAGEVIPGWDEALTAMRAGERRTLIVPWWLGYGERGRLPLIPARATLVFDLELVGVESPP